MKQVLTKREIELLKVALDWTIGETRWESENNLDYERRAWFSEQTIELEELKEKIININKKAESKK